MDADGSNQRRLTEDEAEDWWPAWSPDSAQIAFMSDRDGDWEIYVMNANGRDLWQLTDNSADDREPAWSPDGTRIAFVSNRDSGLPNDYEILKTRDYVMVNQRGTHYAEPFLACPRRTELQRELAGQGLTLQERNRQEVEFLLDCQDDLLNQGINLSAYNSAENAADVNDLRLAQGYEQINLYGISYGSRLALTMSRSFSRGGEAQAVAGTTCTDVHDTSAKTRILIQKKRPLQKPDFARCS